MKIEPILAKAKCNCNVSFLTHFVFLRPRKGGCDWVFAFLILGMVWVHSFFCVNPKSIHDSLGILLHNKDAYLFSCIPNTHSTSTSHQCRIFLSGKRSYWISHQSFSSTFTESSKNAREAARQQRRKTPSTKKEGGGEIVMKTVSWIWNFFNVIWQHWNIAINVAYFLCWALLYLYYKNGP